MHTFQIKNSKTKLMKYVFYLCNKQLVTTSLSKDYTFHNPFWNACKHNRYTFLSFAYIIVKSRLINDDGNILCKRLLGLYLFCVYSAVNGENGIIIKSKGITIAFYTDINDSINAFVIIFNVFFFRKFGWKV